MTRQQDLLDARAAADDFANERGLPPSGGYSGQWYQDGYLSGWWPDGWVKWWAAYGIEPGSILGNLIVAHQYGSTPIDSDVMLDSEIVGGTDTPVTDPEREAMQSKIDGLVGALGYVAGDLLKPVAAQKTGSKAVQKLVAGIRGVADQQGIQHA